MFALCTSEEDLLPDHLREAWRALHRRFLLDSPERRVAVFDLDDTLINGDVGDELLSLLIHRGLVRRLSWEQYRMECSTDPDSAYRNAVRAMAGLPEKTVRNAVDSLLSMPLLAPDPWMHALVRLLQKYSVEVYVLSASSAIAVQVVAERFFGIEPTHAFGIRTNVVNEILTDELVEPAPVGAGKVEVYHQFIGTVQPVVAAGNSLSDVPMLRLLHPEGLRIWRGGATIPPAIEPSLVHTPQASVHPHS